jgi:hypothetical protein
MLVLDKNYMQMTTDFEGKAVICGLLLRFRKKRNADVGLPFKQPKELGFKPSFINY